MCDHCICTFFGSAATGLGSLPRGSRCHMPAMPVTTSPPSRALMSYARRHVLPRPSRASARARDASDASDDEPTECVSGAGQLEGTREGSRGVGPCLPGPCGEASVRTTRYEISRGIFTLLPGDHYIMTQTTGRPGAMVPVKLNGVLIAVAVDEIRALRFLFNLHMMCQSTTASFMEVVRGHSVMEEGAEAVRQLIANQRKHAQTTSAMTPSPTRSTRPRRASTTSTSTET